jgi:hypothetical protein
VNPLAVRTYPGGAVADTPFVFGKTFRAYLKPAGTVPAKWFLFLATVAFKPSGFAPSVAAFSFVI